MNQWAWIPFKIIFCVMIIGCVGSEGTGKSNPKNISQGANAVMKNYSFGRFLLSVPFDMSLDAHSARIREIQIIESEWPNTPTKENSRENFWNKNISEISKLRKPDGVKNIIIEQRTLSQTGQWSKAVYYYGNHAQNDEGFWDILIDAGETCVWFKYNGLVEAKEEMFQWVLQVARAYQLFNGENLLNNRSGNFFFLKYGTINIPYKHQESTYARFEGHPLNLKLELEMNETHTDEPKDEGLLARTAAVIATGYATGVDIDRIRSRKRKVAGLDGEEEVDRMTDSHRAALSFGWRYAGKKDSGEYPEIVIRMESPDAKLEDKLKIWDAILESMKPLYKN